MTTPVLKLFAELVQNRSQRLQFDVSSPNGILLFREASKIICTYGEIVVKIDLVFCDQPTLQIAIVSKDDGDFLSI